MRSSALFYPASREARGFDAPPPATPYRKKPKPVFATRWIDFAGILKTPALAAEFFALVQGIEGGDGVPPACYRAGVDRDPDALLENQGIMHLHLGGRDSDVLVFLILYSDRVVLLASNTHVHFRTRPPGKNILALTQSWLGNLEREMHEAAVAAEASTVAAEREAAKARRAKLAASRAACKAKTGIV